MARVSGNAFIPLREAANCNEASPTDSNKASCCGTIVVGSADHKNLFCRMLLSTFNPYKPAVIDWPPLEKEALDRLTALPIWDIAVQTENRAGLNIASYSETVSDPLLKKAIELNAFEEKRHRHVLANLVDAYGITLAPEPLYPRPKDPEWAFMVTGYSECIDSFFAFGLFEAAKRTAFFPKALVDTFEPVMHEEARHILFYVNWVAWHRRNMPMWRRPWFELKALAVWAFLVSERIGIASNLDHGVQDNNFTVNGAGQLGVELRPAELMDLCLVENDRRLSAYDPRLLRPRLIPALVRFARRFMRLGATA
ncbi:MAG: ferritin-like domain-containing protein [Alphaproteobacteria bacterium]|nr:ferritin-like domain-containing protein [Alphaproteobacteria bacterium]MDE2496066.1 ferritin-like domain-containing protein [Alphaproteobacteria bacterium]